MPLADAATGEIRQSQIFLAVLGASTHIFACATPTQATADSLGAFMDALQFMGSVPWLIVPDLALA